MTIPRLLAMSDYWGKNPPVHEVVLAIGKGFGLREKAQAPSEIVAADDAFDLLTREFTAAGGIVVPE